MSIKKLAQSVFLVLLVCALAIGDWFFALWWHEFVWMPAKNEWYATGVVFTGVVLVMLVASAAYAVLMYAVFRLEAK